jgi:hypothetical protein
MDGDAQGRRRLLKLTIAGATLAAGLVAVPAAYAATAQTGFVQVCKAASGAGVTGTFQFKIAGVAAPVAVPVGGCSKSIKVTAGKVAVTEVAQPGVAVASVATDPVGRVVSANLAAGRAVVKVPAGSVHSQTKVTFTNKAVGYVQVCKKAAAGDSLTGTFAFAVTSGASTTTVNVAVGACSRAVQLAPGTATVTEATKTGAALAAIDVVPADRAVSSDVAKRTATVKVVQGAATAATVVTFTNKTVPPPPTGTLRVCKVAGAGVVAGQEFTFTIGSATATVKAGACGSPMTLPVGNVTVKETAVKGFAVSAITVTGAGSLVSSDLATGTAVVKVVAGATDVNVTNKVVPTGCVRSSGYYANHEDAVKKLLAANGGTLSIGGVALTAAQIDAIYGRSSSNFLNQVSAQLITARLNQLGGASAPAAVQAAIDAAQALEKAAGGPLTGTATPQTKVVVGGVTYTASQLVATLSAYNEGTAAGGPATCA